MSFSVLHVCTGNICRSPMAERLSRAMLAERLGARADVVAVESAGTWARSGTPMEPEAIRTLLSYGIDARDFRARELVAEHVAAADLVLAATREHRAAAVVLQPRAAARTFTLREFARLTALVDPTALPGGDTVQRAQALVRAVAAQRGRVPPARPADDDLDDPYRASGAVFAGCAALVHESLHRPLDLLCGVGTAGSAPAGSR